MKKAMLFVFAILMSTSFSFANHVELAVFSGKIIGGNVDLTWVTSLEYNNDCFAVEKSTDGMNYKAIGMIDGKGYSDMPEQYGFTDYNPSIGMNYYRLKIVDLNGVNTYSDPILITYDKKITINAYPNPVVESLNVSINGTHKGTIQVMNASGEVVIERYIAVKGDEIISINVSNLRRGNYILKVTTNNGSESTQFIKSDVR